MKTTWRVISLAVINLLIAILTLYISNIFYSFGALNFDDDEIFFSFIFLCILVAAVMTDFAFYLAAKSVVFWQEVVKSVLVGAAVGLSFASDSYISFSLDVIKYFLLIFAIFFCLSFCGSLIFFAIRWMFGKYNLGLSFKKA